MNFSSIGSKGLVFLLCISLVGCASSPAKPKTETSADAKPVFPQDLATIDVQHDRTSYRSSFSTDTNRTLPMLFLVGDSTVHNYDGGRVGWGDLIGNYFDTNKIQVENHALGGRSSRTFITQGWWRLVLKEAKPGDFVMIQMGHNDGGEIDDTNRARGSLPGLGDEQKEIFNSVTQKPETVHTYGWYLRKYISDARAKGMTPVLCTPVSRLPTPGKELDTTRCAVWVRELAVRENTPLIDLNRLVLARWDGKPLDEIKTNYFVQNDNTHFNLAGAQVNAACVIDGLRALTNCPLTGFLKTDSAAK